MADQWSISDQWVTIGGLGADCMELVMAINDATWTIDQARRSMAHVVSQDHYRRTQQSAHHGPRA